MNNPISLLSYSSAFSRCYPGKTISFKRAPHSQWWVVINGDQGARPLSLAEIESSTRDFNRGKVVAD